MVGREQGMNRVIRYDWRLLMKYKLSCRIRINIVIHVIAYIEHHMRLVRNPTFQVSKKSAFESSLLKFKI